MNETDKEAFERLVSENGEYNRRILRLMNELSSNPISQGLTELQAVKAINTEMYKLQTLVRELTTENCLLKNKLNNSQEVFVRELVEVLNKK